MLYLLAVGGVLWGTMLGLFFRLLLFVLVLLLSIAVMVVGSLVFGEHSILLHVMVAVVALQIGYIVGIAVRTVIRRNNARGEAGGRDVSRYLRPAGKPKQH
jgi:hypothetical protein